jgi:hypothetical protein
MTCMGIQEYPIPNIPKRKDPHRLSYLWGKYEEKWKVNTSAKS